MHKLISSYSGASRRVILPAGTRMAVFIGKLLVISGDTRGDPSNTDAALSNIANQFAIQQQAFRRMVFDCQFGRAWNPLYESEQSSPSIVEYRGGPVSSAGSRWSDCARLLIMQWCKTVSLFCYLPRKRLDYCAAYFQSASRLKCYSPGPG